MQITACLGMAALGCLALAPARAADEHAVLAIPGTNMLFLVQYIAKDEHLWQKQGLDVKVHNIIGIGSMNAVISGSADFSMSSGPSITRANARGQKLVALATAINQSGQDIVIRKDIADAAHFDPNAPLAVRGKILKGRTFAVGGVGAIPDIVLKVVAKDAGIAPDDVTVTPMQPPEFMAAFRARRSTASPTARLSSSRRCSTDGRDRVGFDQGRADANSRRSRPRCCWRAPISARRTSRSAPRWCMAWSRRPTSSRPTATHSLKVMKAHFGTYDDKVLAAAYDMLRQMTPDPPIDDAARSSRTATT